jgi:hypothetical protein
MPKLESQEGLDDAVMKAPIDARTLSHACFALALLVAGCGSDASNGDATVEMPGTVPNPGAESTAVVGEPGVTSAAGASGPLACGVDNTVAATSARNFSFWSTVTLPTLTQVAPGVELSFDWSQVTTDFLGKAVDPAADVILVTVALWQMTPAAFATAINDDTLGSPAVAAFLQTQGQLTSTNLFTLSSPAGPIPEDQMLSFFDIGVYPPGGNFYTLMLGSDLTPGVNTRMIGGFELNSETTNTQVVLDDGSTQLEYGVDFSASQPTPVPAGVADVIVDWSGMETLSLTETDPTKLNAAGRPFLKRSIKQVKVARYTQSEAELQQKETILRIDDLADDMYTGEVVSGSTFALSNLTDASGAPFNGIDSTHTWILALIDTDSKNPAPWYLTFLRVCE